MEVNRSIELCRRVVTTSSLIDEAMAIYGDKYTYGKLNYINLHHKVVITCPKHGDFKEYARRFLDGDECPRCRKEEHFINRLEAKFGDRFGLGELNYVSSTKPVTLICPKHGRFSRLIGSILASSCGCQECGNEKLQNICDKAHQDAVERKDKRRVRCHSFDECLEAAMKCTRRSEFQRRYYKLYSYARSHGWLDKCCQHMGKSYDIFSPRCIYAYEFNIGGERYAYVGLTMDKNARRSEHHRRKGSSVYKFCKEHGIRISGPRLGRPGKDQPADVRQELQEIGERNEVEGRFGNGKRKLGLSLIMAKLKETAGSMIAMDIFILNMERLFRRKMLFLYTFFVTAENGTHIQFYQGESTFGYLRFA